MTLFDAAMLGLIQGLTEFLPVSSSGHLVLLQKALGLGDAGGVQFEVAVHLATCFAIGTVYWSEIAALLAELPGLLRPDRYRIAYNERPRFRLLVLLVLSAIPIGIIGILFKDVLEEYFHSVPLVCACLLFTALVLFLGQRSRREDPEEQSTLRTALVMGSAQVIAILPGVSRSGMTISAGLMAGLSREEAARFSFLMVLAPLLGASVLELRHGFAGGPGLPAVAAGMVVAYVSGVVALKLLLRLVARGRLDWFSPYCVLVAVLGFVFLR